ncbi:MAG: S8 family serine peptidase [Bacteroidia bacterium]|nr:S8 family serine peptidase [Bacteroidia bacterium]
MMCPICLQDHGPLVHYFPNPSDGPTVEALRAELPGWQPESGACTRCVDQAQLAACQRNPGDRHRLGGQERMGYTILPIPARLSAHTGYTGKGVTICFIDSGFVRHPDLCEPDNRILRMFDIRWPEEPIRADSSGEPAAACWHGTMTAVTGAGNGWCSAGYYRSLAPDAQVVLIRVMDDAGVISDQALADALQWVCTHHAAYGIRIVNLSVSGDNSLSYKASPVGQRIAALAAEGVLVVAAAGNQAGAALKAPANAPHALTVGGLDDHNTLFPLGHTLYHSTYGETADHTYKPDLIAPAIWLAAPLLPGSAAQREAEALWSIQEASPRHRHAVLTNTIHQTKLSRQLLLAPAEALEQAIAARMESAKYISPHYQHADGTSFAAPIVCSVAAQLLEARPDLSPAALRDILLRTARPLPGVPAERQGFGVLHPLSAVTLAAEDDHPLPPLFHPVVDYHARQVHFYFHHETCNSVQLAGGFDGWKKPGRPLVMTAEHHWTVTLDLPAPGVYPYKFMVNNQDWVTDTRNLYQVPDGLGGFHSLLVVDTYGAEY